MEDKEKTVQVVGENGTILEWIGLYLCHIMIICIGLGVPLLLTWLGGRR